MVPSGLFEHPVLQATMKGFREVAAKEGVELIMLGGQNDPATQNVFRIRKQRTSSTSILAA
jgi:ABC-type uncharacterized transport system substrate-binding protein